MFLKQDNQMHGTNTQHPHTIVPIWRKSYLLLREQQSYSYKHQMNTESTVYMMCFI